MTRVHNFSSGPCTLPVEVLEEAQAEFVDYHGSGMSLIEMSHRSDAYEAVHFRAMELARDLTEAPDDFEVLFVQGGATLQFVMAPVNLLQGTSRAGYAVTGSWAKRAFADGGHHGDIYSAWDGGPDFSRIPAGNEIEIRPDTRYLHITTNETIGGIQYRDWPDVGVPLVADVSSDFMSRSIPWSLVDVVYGGVQKNLGPAGMAVVFVREAALPEAVEAGAYLRYETHAAKRSMFNTPPVFAVYMVGKVLSWMKDQGGVPAMAKAADHKAGLVYETIDGSGGFYRSPVDPNSRSVMNVVFRLPTEELEGEFVKAADDRGLVFLKGHRSVGGCRAGLYNAMPVEGVEHLVEFMKVFQESHA